MFRRALLRLRWRRIARDDRGAVAVLAVVVMPVVLGFGALGIDASHLYLNRNLLQTTADSAARAAADHLGNTAQVIGAARYYAGRNMPTQRYGDVLPAANVQLGIWNGNTRTFVPTADAAAANAVEVTTVRDVPLTLARIWGSDTSMVQARAVAALVGVPGEACVLALGLNGLGEENAADSLHFQGASGLAVNSPGCAFATNSQHADSVKITGNPGCGDVHLYSVYSRATSAYLGNICLEDPPRFRQNRFVDPYAGFQIPNGLSFPTLPNQQGNNSVTLQPGIYTQNIRYTGNFDVYLDPGVYVFKGEFSIGGSVRLHGEGVTLIYAPDNWDYDTPIEPIIEASETVDPVAGNSRMTISAPTTGDTAGLALVVLGGPKLDLRGNGTISIDGSVYAPHSLVETGGNGELITDNCLQIVGNRVMFSGSASFTNEGCDDMNVPQIERLVSSLVM